MALVRNIALGSIFSGWWGTMAGVWHVIPFRRFSGFKALKANSEWESGVLWRTGVGESRLGNQRGFESSQKTKQIRRWKEQSSGGRSG